MTWKGVNSWKIKRDCVVSFSWLRYSGDMSYMYDFLAERSALCKQESCPGPAELKSLLSVLGATGNRSTMAGKRPMAPFALVFYINYFAHAVSTKTVNAMWMTVYPAISLFTYVHRCDTAGAKLQLCMSTNNLSNFREQWVSIWVHTARKYI